MNLKEQLLVEMSRRNTDFIAHSIDNDSDSFKDLMELVFHGAEPLPSRASWVVTAVTEKYPELLKPYLKKIIAHMDKFEHPGTRRNLLRYLASINLPLSLQGKLFDMCSGFILSRTEPIAIKAHSMQIMFNIAQKEPDLKNEVRLILEELEHHESAGIKSRSAKLLRSL
jgi:hypothetical protein